MNDEDKKAFETWWRTTDELGRYTEQQETWKAALAYRDKQLAEMEPVTWMQDNNNINPTFMKIHPNGFGGKDSLWHIPLIIRPSKEQS